MTVPIKVKKKCSVCGFVSRQSVLASTSRFGASDLDTRPPEMMRSTMGWWVQECPACGFVSRDISKKTRGVTKSFLKSESYISCKGMSFENDYGERFFKAFLSHVHAKKWEDAFWYILYCAWICDDADDSKNAVICRWIAIKCLTKFPTNDTLQTIRADLMRRAGMFSHVLKEYEHFQCRDKMLNQIVRFEVEKARRKDAECYSLDSVR